MGGGRGKPTCPGGGRGCCCCGSCPNGGPGVGGWLLAAGAGLRRGRPAAGSGSSSRSCRRRLLLLLLDQLVVQFAAAAAGHQGAVRLERLRLGVEQAAGRHYNNVLCTKRKRNFRLSRSVFYFALLHPVVHFLARFHTYFDFSLLLHKEKAFEFSRIAEWG